jgi:alkylation response protein AidB-like acyl-CoA dehydrogenase
MTTTVAPDVSLPLVPPDDERAIREAVRGICARFGDRYGRECYERGEPPTEAWRALTDKGFVGIDIAEQWGGGGMGMRGLIAVAEEVSAAGIPALMLVVSAAMAGSILALHGTEEQNERWLRGIAAGTTKLAFGITEPDAGTNSHNMRIELRRDGDRYLLRGQKVFISAVEDAEAVLVVARFRGEDGQLGLPCLCIVDVDAPGFTRDVIPMPYLGPDQQWTLYFEDVEIAPDRLVGGESGGLAVAFDALNPERIIAGAIACGTARLMRVAPVNAEMILNYVAQHSLGLPRSY